MKTMKHYSCMIALALLGVLLVIPGFASSERTGTQTRKTASFHGISVSSGIDLYLTQGDAEKVVVKADPDVIDEVLTEVRDGILHIYMKKQRGWPWDKERAAYVTFDDLNRLDVSAGADVESQNAFNLDEIQIAVSSGADVELDDLTANSVWLDTSSGSDAELSGITENLEASSSSGADISCGDLVAKYCWVNVSSGADVVVHVTEELKASASSGGDIRYKGNPIKKDISESSGGDVYKY
ncbi:head GIN domain-containing protein [uncultured Sunxiuqinia sp.]|uniref:head GIN domain-containing protein n=1 Tax=uncultured Sunxiuqinia sp. TaxID=1573825 RepID=UPI00260317B1|nr:head GIN domain-containing protein [uncultured Sunxiuqinia sp.]